MTRREALQNIHIVAGPRFSLKNILSLSFPSLFAIVLFTVAIFGIFVPAVTSNLMEEKKKALTLLTQTTLSILAYYNNQAQNNAISVDEAQMLAVSQIRELRYGEDGKAYFWINDLHPKMIMHPYRDDLDGQDLSNFTDQEGRILFQEMVDIVKTDGAGFLPYFWQWQDVPNHITRKLSYVKLFEPWGWIIGTGMYFDDVDKEISAIKEKLIRVSLAILAVIVFLSFIICRKSFIEQNKRHRVEEIVIQYQNHLEDLVQKRTNELEKALDEVKTLSGFLPICSSCKKIRDDQGYWKQIETYISQHSEARFSHGICPDCIKELYPEYYNKKFEKLESDDAGSGKS